MVKHLDQITLDGLPAFTKLCVQTTLQNQLALPSDACYLYIEQGEGHLIYKPGGITATPGTTILSSCGLTVGKMIAEQPKGSIPLSPFLINTLRFNDGP